MKFLAVDSEEKKGTYFIQHITDLWKLLPQDVVIMIITGMPLKFGQTNSWM